MKIAILICLLVAAALAVTDPSIKLIPPGPGRDVVVKVCGECHPADNFRSKRFDRDGWTEQVSNMMGQGAKANDAEQDIIIGYLTAVFGPDSKIYMNTAPYSEVRAVLGLTLAETTALIEYRKEHGDFKDWQQVAKIPGVGAVKVEAKKDLMVF
jgi:competence protein ComEA